MRAPPIPADAVRRFRGWVHRRTGLWFADARLERLAQILGERLRENRCDADTYLSAVASEPRGTEELRRLVPGLTTTETYFFRGQAQLEAFAEVVQGRVRADGAPRPLRILSAGCASGEEPYSLAMTLLGVPGGTSFRPLVVEAFDLDPTMLERAARAHYGEWALRETPPHLRARWFRSRGSAVELDRTVVDMVRFSQRSLSDDDPAFWRRDAFDVVFCRNVLMYFSPEEVHAAVARIAGSLVPGGHLFLGHAETLRGVSDAFELQQSRGAFLYRRRDGERRSRPPSTTPPPPSTRAAGEPPLAPRQPRSSPPVVALAPPPRDLLASPDPWKPPDLRAALQHLAEDRLAEAGAALDALPAGSAERHEVLLVRAVLLTHGGDLGAAELACIRLLAADDRSADAHHLLALCREGAGDCAGAMAHDRAAIDLDPGFALARFHLGRLARVAGDEETARRELERALTLLDDEDAVRLALFGGGFSRATLRRMCLTASTGRRGDA